MSTSPHRRRLGKASVSTGKLASAYLFGDQYPCIDGTTERPPRPLQLKEATVTESSDSIPRFAGEALKKARGAGSSRVEASIEAASRTVVLVHESFIKYPTRFTDSTGARVER